MCAGLRNRMKARTSLYSVILPLLTLPTAGTISTVALKDVIDSYSTAIRLSNDALSAVRSVWGCVLLTRGMSRRRDRHEVSVRTEHERTTKAATRRNSINSL